jgi:RNA polymerase sigma-70 factor (ECF subfamily)
LSEPAREPSDEDLLHLIASGDREALAMLYRRHQDIVFRFAFQMSGSDFVAEDMVQETFLALTRSAARYTPGAAKFTTYLYAIVRNLTRRRLRRDRRAWNLRMWTNQPWPREELPAEQTLIDAATRQHTIERVRQAVLSLPSRYREAVVLCDLHDRNYAEAAAIVGCPVGTLRSRLHRGRNLLGEKLGYSRMKADCG